MKKNKTLEGVFIVEVERVLRFGRPFAIRIRLFHG